MHHWQDEGIIIRLSPLGETKHLAWLFTKTQGLIKGVVYRSTRTPLDLGMMVQVTAKAKLPEQLHTLSIDTARQPYIKRNKIAYVSRMCAHLVQTLAEHHPYPQLYSMAIDLLQTKLQVSAGYYVRFEEMLLAQLGFGLSLDRCTVTQTTENLVFVSPNTGKAVCYAVGLPYVHKLLPLPPFMQTKCYADAPQDQINKGLALTNYFIDKFLKNKP